MSNNIYTLSQLNKAFPNTHVDRINETEFLDVNDNEGGRTFHPVVQLLNEKVVSAMSVVHSWTDDHCACFLLEIEFVGDEETYFLPLWWFDPTYLLLAGQAIGNIEKGREFAAIFNVG